MENRPLGKITAILSDLGLEVTYAYDDLVFVQECAFLLQFMASPTELRLSVNTECHPDVATEVAGDIVLKFGESGFSVTPVGRYFLTPNDNETLDIEFAPA